MARYISHNAVVYMGKANGKNVWKQVGKVLHDTDKGKDTLWIDPHAMRNVLNKLGATGEDIPVLLAPKTGRGAVRHYQPATVKKEPWPSFDTPSSMAKPTPAPVTEPPMDFDDDIPFN